MHDLIFKFCKKYNIKISITEMKKNDIPHVIFKLINIENENLQTLPIFIKTDIKYTDIYLSYFVYTVITSIINKTINNIIIESYIQILTEQGFKEFISLDIKNIKDVIINNCITPIKPTNKCTFIIKILNEKQKMYTFLMFQELKEIIDTYKQKKHPIEEIIIKDAKIENFIFLQSLEIHSLQIENCIIHGFMYINLLNILKIGFFQCIIESFESPIHPLLKELNINECTINKNEPITSAFYSNAERICISGEKINSFINIIPTKNEIPIEFPNLISFKILATGIKAMIGFPKCSKLHSLHISNNLYLISLKGLPSELLTVKECVISNNRKLHSAFNFPIMSELFSLDINGSVFFTDIFPHFPKLTILNINSCYMKTLTLLCMNCPSLKEISAVKMCDAIYSDLFNSFNFPSLTKIILEGTKIIFTPITEQNTFFLLLKSYSSSPFFISSKYMNNIILEFNKKYNILNTSFEYTIEYTNDFYTLFTYCTSNTRIAISYILNYLLTYDSISLFPLNEINNNNISFLKFNIYKKFLMNEDHTSNIEEINACISQFLNMYPEFEKKRKEEINALLKILKII